MTHAAPPEQRDIAYRGFRLPADLAAGVADGVRATDRGLVLAEPAARLDHTDADGRTRRYAAGRWTSPPVPAGFAVHEVVPSWTGDTPGDSWLRVELRGWRGREPATGWYVLADWAADDQAFRRTSVPGQCDADARVDTDTLVVTGATVTGWQVRVTLLRPEGAETGPVPRPDSAETGPVPRPDGAETGRVLRTEAADVGPVLRTVGAVASGPHRAVPVVAPRPTAEGPPQATPPAPAGTDTEVPPGLPAPQTAPDTAVATAARTAAGTPADTVATSAGTAAGTPADTVAATAAGAATAPGRDAGRARAGWGIVLDVPRYSQRLHAGAYPQFGGGGDSWCSPTCTSMVLAYWGAAPEPERYAWVTPPGPRPVVVHAARNCCDHAYAGAGNWPFNTAYAGLHGVDAFVTRLRSLVEAEAFVAAGIPLIVSAAFRAGEVPGLDYETAGHLMVLVGFTATGEPVLNDPYAPDDDGVRRTVDRDRFEAAWQAGSGGVAYVLHPPSVPLPPPPAQPNW